MSVKRSFTTWSIAGAWALFVIAAVTLGDLGWGLWRRQNEGLRNAQERLSRLKGWLTVEEQVEERRNQLLGPFARAGNSDFSWLGLEAVQKAAQVRGLSVTELRPIQVPGRGGQPPTLRLDAKVEGRLDEMSSFLEQLPETLPGVRMEMLQIVPQEGDQVQGLLRLALISAQPGREG